MWLVAGGGAAVLVMICVTVLSLRVASSRRRRATEWAAFEHAFWTYVERRRQPPGRR